MKTINRQPSDAYVDCLRLYSSLSLSLYLSLSIIWPLLPLFYSFVYMCKYACACLIVLCGHQVFVLLRF